MGFGARAAAGGKFRMPGTHELLAGGDALVLEGGDGLAFAPGDVGEAEPVVYAENYVMPSEAQKSP